VAPRAETSGLRSIRCAERPRAENLTWSWLGRWIGSAGAARPDRLPVRAARPWDRSVRAPTGPRPDDPPARRAGAAIHHNRRAAIRRIRSTSVVVVRARGRWPLRIHTVRIDGRLARTAVALAGACGQAASHPRIRGIAVPYPVLSERASVWPIGEHPARSTPRPAA
jgi:hypothetical protein